MKQKEIFFNSEGNNWLKRNQFEIEQKDYSLDKVCIEIKKIDPEKKARVLEIGCSAGHRLSYLKSLGYTVKGIEPSLNAVKEALNNGVDVTQGTADEMNIEDQSIDFLIFGFCLYLVDPADYFKVASESYRILADNGSIIIHDFAPKSYYKNKYIHLDGIHSYKFDFSQFLTIHPHFVLKNKITEIHSQKNNDLNNQDQWVQISVISKHTNLF